jgi:hypothetical protein
MILESNCMVWTVGHSNHSWNQFRNCWHWPKSMRSATSGLRRRRGFPTSIVPHWKPASPPLTSRTTTLDSSSAVDLAMGMRLTYEAMARPPPFREGLERVEAIASNARLALMCSEHAIVSCWSGGVLPNAVSMSGIFSAMAGSNSITTRRNGYSASLA